jgi:hypothetical protein
LIAVSIIATTMFDGLDLDDAPLDDDGTIVVKRRKVCLTGETKLTIFRFLEGQLVDDLLPHGALTAAAKLASCCVNACQNLGNRQVR